MPVWVVVYGMGSTRTLDFESISLGNDICPVLNLISIRFLCLFFFIPAYVSFIRLFSLSSVTIAMFLSIFSSPLCEETMK